MRRHWLQNPFIMHAMRNPWILLLTLLTLSFDSSAYPETQTLPKYGTGTFRLYNHHDYLRKNLAPDFWALIPHYAQQKTGSACSIASATMILNGIRAPEDLTSSIDLYTQDNVLERTGSAPWKKATANRGGGTTLQELRAYFSQALTKLKLDDWQVDAIHAENTPEFAKRLRALLIENEQSDRNFLIVNYLQGKLTGDPEGLVGHLAPIAAYNSKKQEVLILDPDRQYYEPYWVSETALLQAASTRDSTSDKNRGFLWVHQKKSN
ncbi:MAG: hypothetical protein RJB38_318 [Pseudomonadota bacterium]|jgi:hypothetical protein